MLPLKPYQTETLRQLQKYLEAARAIGPNQAFGYIEKPSVHTGRPYTPLVGREATPYVCLRLPTGGGKTLLSAYSIKIAADAYMETECPTVLWLVPTNTIRAQTLETLQRPGHPNYEAIADAFDGR